MLVGGAHDYRDALIRRAREHVDTLCVGRTHGVHAEPTTSGSSWRARVRGAPEHASPRTGGRRRVGGGPVRGRGHHSANGPEVEETVLRLGLGREDVSTQVVPRDRHAELLEAIALAGAGLERFAIELRHLQRTEVREVEEPFRSGTQKGSSAMPHKRNPIVSERITGIARLLRGYALTGLENVALWHERDISHSSVERVSLPDATILLDYAQHLAIRVVDGMTIHPERMRENLAATHALYSQRALLALVEAGRPATRPTERAGRAARLGRGHRVPRAAHRECSRARSRHGLRSQRLRAPLAHAGPAPGSHHLARRRPC